MDHDPRDTAEAPPPAKPETGPAATVDDAITGRRSIRRFLPKPVPETLVRHLLAVASRAPSGTNMQPWRVHVLAGAAKTALSEAILKAFHDDRFTPEQAYKYYPDSFPEPYRSRRRAVGWGLYGLLGIKKGETEKMRAQAARNYLFFDAPVGLIFTIDAILEIGSWLDYGGFLQNIAVAARGHGLHTCPQAAFARYHAVIQPRLGIADTETVVCGMSLGYADPEAPENSLVTAREPVSAFASFQGFD